MRETIGAFEIGVMPAPEAEEPISESRTDQPNAWPLLAALCVQVFACLSLAR